MKGIKTKKTFLSIDDGRVFSNAVRDCLSDDSVEALTAKAAVDGISFCHRKMINVVLLGKRRISSLP